MLMLNFCFAGVVLSGIAMVCGFISLNTKDKETEEYITRLKQENRRLKRTVYALERKVKGEKMVRTLSAEEVNE